jgi:hypothetical protein
MKSNLVLKQFDTDKKPGTMNVRNLKTFFGGKMAITEDNITVNDDAIEFSYVYGGKNTGYQYFDNSDIPDDWEKEFVENLTDVKNNFHSITLLNQTSKDLSTNTRWGLEINARDILREYLFFKFKESRAFQVINYNELYNNSINDTIYNYIEWNVLGSYKFDSIDLYILYSDIPKSQSIGNNILLQFKPEFTGDVYLEKNKVINFNVINLDEYDFSKITINYFQIKSSDTYKFDYYFDLNFIKI